MGVEGVDRVFELPLKKVFKPRRVFSPRLGVSTELVFSVVEGSGGSASSAGVGFTSSLLVEVKVFFCTIALEETV